MWSPAISSDEIYHHGIQGMHWGQRNGPPYPLKEGAHSPEEKRAKYQKRIASNERSANRYRAKAAKLRVKAAKLNRRRLINKDDDTSFFSRARRANRKELKASKLERKAAKRERTALILKKKMSDIDVAKAAEVMSMFGTNGKKTWAEKRADAKKAKQRMKNLKKARDVRQKNKEMAERKEEILRRGSAQDIRKIRDQLTEDDYKRVFNRLDNERKLEQKINENVKTGKDRFNDYMSTLATVATATQNAVNVYNNVAKTYNTFSKSGKKLPTIGGPTKEEQFKKFLENKADLNTVLANREKMNSTELTNALTRFKRQDELLKYKNERK